MIITISVLFGQGYEGETDIYEYMADLFDQLIEWRDIDSTTTDAFSVDSIDVSEIFSSYSYEVVQAGFDTIFLNAKLPPYLGLLSTELSYSLIALTNGALSVEYHSPILYSDEGVVFDDSCSIILTGLKSTAPVLADQLYHRLHLYRSLALPPIFRPLLIADSSSATLHFHGRDTDSLSYRSFDHLLRTLYLLAAGKMVYAVPVSVAREERTLTFRFFILLTTKGAYGNHFITIDEVFSRDGITHTKTNTVMHLYPYVRVDNLLSLYSRGHH